MLITTNLLKMFQTDNIWNTLWENEEGETEDINEEYLEDIVDKIMIQNAYLIDI